MLLICPCTHHYSFHDPESGRCYVTVIGAAIAWDSRGRAMQWQQAQCPCRRYAEPEPLPDYRIPDIGG